MDITYFIKRFAANARAVEGLASGLTDEQAHWKPTQERWCILEVVCHMYDEERLDFRARLDSTLSDPERAWIPINPPGWISMHEYAKQDLQKSIANFLEERERSLDWLTTLEDPSLKNSYDHQEFGQITAGDLLASWLAHDALHIRQITRLHYEYVAQHASPYKLDYAGPW